MFWKGKRVKIIHVILFVAVIIITIGLYVSVHYFNNTKNILETGNSSGNFEFALDISKSWDETAHGYVYGMQYDGEMKNFSDYEIKDWEVTIEFKGKCQLDSYWNGEFSVDDNTLKITPLSYNNPIEVDEIQPFGFVLYADNFESVLSCTITYYRQMSVTDVSLFWVVVIVVGFVITVDITMLINDIQYRKLQANHEELQGIINQSFRTFANMIDAKDPYTKGHSQRVALYSKEIARRMGLGKSEQQHLFYIAMLHDIGKIGIPDAILNKKDKLTAEERRIVEEHVSIGGDILKDFTAIKGIENGARYHHERYDGNGYVVGLKGKEIPLYARIICVADVFDVMSRARCYRPESDKEDIIAELKRCSGTQFDPEIVPHMLAMIEDGMAPIVLEEGMIPPELEDNSNQE